MKDKELAELRVYVFAMHIGQHVFNFNHPDITETEINISTLCYAPDERAYLQLRPLSSINMQDALTVINVFSPISKITNYQIRYKLNPFNEKFAQVYSGYEGNETIHGNFGIDGTFHALQTNRCETALFAHQCAIQMGYASPVFFKGVQYSVEDLVSKGIITLLKS